LQEDEIKLTSKVLFLSLFQNKQTKKKEAAAEIRSKSVLLKDPTASRPTPVRWRICDIYNHEKDCWRKEDWK